eukprot:m.96078 g.96078  ORF g.96078 m.96078 type:complete len:57 (-) comp16633_c0_seq2:155-325(-)
MAFSPNLASIFLDAYGGRVTDVITVRSLSGGRHCYTCEPLRSEANVAQILHPGCRV